MKNYVGRKKDLKDRLNKHLKKLTGQEKDFFSILSSNELLDLKTVLADINNVLTLKMTNSAVNWICKIFHMKALSKRAILKKVDETKPNANGYDIHVDDPKKIIAEVKCIAPINNGQQYGGAQWNSILDDTVKLKNGKGKVKKTSGYFKFLFLIDLGERTDQAITKLMKPSKSKSEIPRRANRHKIKKHIVLLGNKDKKKDLLLSKVYIKTIRLR